MKVPQTPIIDPKTVQSRGKKTEREVSPEMRKAAQGLEAVFTTEMMKAMRSTVEPSEFSLHNSASDIYQGMLDEEYSDIAAKQNSLGLSEQIIDYWLRDKASQPYNQGKAAKAELPGSSSKAQVSSNKMSTGGTHEDQSNN